DICQSHQICLVESAREIIEEQFGARVAVRLKEHNHTPSARFCSRKSRLDLSRMMAIVIHYHYVLLLSLDLEPAIDAAKLGKRSGYRIKIDIEIQTNGYRRKGVINVV